MNTIYFIHKGSKYIRGPIADALCSTEQFLEKEAACYVRESTTGNQHYDKNCSVPRNINCSVHRNGWSGYVFLTGCF